MGNLTKNEQFAIYGKDFQGIIRYTLNINEKEISDMDTVRMGKFLKELALGLYITVIKTHVKSRRFCRLF